MSHRSHRSRSRRALLSALPLSALILAGCSGDNSGPAADDTANRLSVHADLCDR